MLTFNLKDAKASFSIVDKALKDEFVTITRHGKAFAALVPVEAAELALKAMDKNRAGLLAVSELFPAANSSATDRRRGMSSFDGLSIRHQRYFDARAVTNGRSGTPLGMVGSAWIATAGGCHRSGNRKWRRAARSQGRDKQGGSPQGVARRPSRSPWRQDPGPRCTDRVTMGVARSESARRRR